jgi:hypothetical protein
MRVGIIQSCYAPWRGFFDFIASVDLFLVFDDVQYTRRNWRNRNQVKTSHGLKWLTVPVSGSRSQAIDEVRISNEGKPWRAAHRQLLTESLRDAPHFQEAMEVWEDGCGGANERLSPLNVRLIQTTCNYLGITTPFADARDYHVTGTKTERLINLLKKTNATTYLSGPSARGYIEEELFSQNSISLEYKTYDYESYPQLWGEFVGTVTVLDLIAQLGPEARDHIRSNTPDLIVVP